MTPRKKKSGSGQLSIKGFLTAKSLDSPKKRGREEEKIEKKGKRKADDTSTTISPGKRARKETKINGSEAAANNNNNNNNNNNTKDAKKDAAATNNNTNNNKSKDKQPKEKKSSPSSKKPKKTPKTTKATTKTGKPKKPRTSKKSVKKENKSPQKSSATNDSTLLINLPDDSAEVVAAERSGKIPVVYLPEKRKLGFKGEKLDSDKMHVQGADDMEVTEDPDEILPHGRISQVVAPEDDDDDDDYDDDDHSEFMAPDGGDLASSVGSPAPSQEVRILIPPASPPKEQKASFKCKVCDQWFPNRYFQRKHMLMEHENQLYECRVCSFNSVNPEKLKSHIIKQHVIKKERSDQVSIDEIKVDLDELMTKHTPRKVIMEDGVALGRDANNKMRFICALCDRIYTSKYSLERHVRCHTGEKPYVCAVCGFSTGYREHMQRHMTSVHLIVHSDEPKVKYVPKNRRKTDEKNVSTEDGPPVVTVQDDPLDSPEGNKTNDNKDDSTSTTTNGTTSPNTTTSTSPTNSSATTESKKARRNILRKRFECAACGMKATHKTDLVNHIREKHPNAHIESLDGGDGSKVHLIVTVSKKTSVSKRMVITCSECFKVFHDTWKYKVHMRSHTGVKPFGCSICSFFATSKMTIRDHIHRKHKDVENPKILLRTVAIDGNVHYVELSMPQRDFKCDYCGELFKDNYDLKLHKKKTHTEAAPFSCSACGFREWARAGILIHCLNEHKDQSIEGLILHKDKKYNMGPFKLPTCQQCDKVFPYQSQLYIHQKQHTGERSFNCDICSYSTNLKSSLERHILQHLDIEAPVKKKRGRGRGKASKTDALPSDEDGDNPPVEEDEDEAAKKKQPAIPFVSVDSVEESGDHEY